LIGFFFVNKEYSIKVIDLVLKNPGSETTYRFCNTLTVRINVRYSDTGSSPFTFSSADVQASGPPPYNIPGISFFGGLLEIVQQ